mmetsp:Transcript_49664/g.124585  ORF Transcript_49664/g.124585 Transcript_49664/m.124585 type:complete len:91 (+) Transcript_49664:2480-2752(+)
MHLSARARQLRHVACSSSPRPCGAHPPHHATAAGDKDPPTPQATHQAGNTHPASTADAAAGANSHAQALSQVQAIERRVVSDRSGRQAEC